MIRTRIYKGDSTGGPIDYAAPIGDVAVNTFTYPGLPLSSRTKFGVRNYDDQTGMEEANVDATIAVVVDGQGADASDVPGQPVAVVAHPSGPTSVLVSWQYLPTPGRPEPTSFAVYMTPGVAVDWTAPPAASVPMRPGSRDFRVTLSGLQPDLSHAFGVRSVRGAANDGNTTSFILGPIPPAPLNVSDLEGTLTFSE